MNINKVIVPDSIGDGVGTLSYKDGKLVSYEHGSVVNVYLFHEDDGESVRALEVTMTAPPEIRKKSHKTGSIHYCRFNWPPDRKIPWFSRRHGYKEYCRKLRRTAGEIHPGNFPEIGR